MSIVMREQRAFPGIPQPLAERERLVTVPRVQQDMPLYSPHGMGPMRHHLLVQMQQALCTMRSAKRLQELLACSSVTLAGQSLTPDEDVLLRGSLLLTIQKQSEVIRQAQEMLETLRMVEQEERERRLSA